MKAPGHPVPSGDRTMARNLMTALDVAGHDVVLASTYRTWDAGSPTRQARLAELGESLARRAARRFAAPRPDAWLTYHLHHKAPDHLGPAVSTALGIPYLVVEASHAEKRATGPWALGHAAAAHAIRQATRLITVNPADDAGLRALVPEDARHARLAPFLDAAPFAQAIQCRAAIRAATARQHGLDPSCPWVVAAAMMRPGDKSASYSALARALARLAAKRWVLLVAGDGPARAEIEAAFAPMGTRRIAFLGRLHAPALMNVLAASDLCAWPAMGEAYGMALLEAQAAGTPVVAGDEGGVSTIVAHGETGILVHPRDDGAFAAGIAALLDDAARRIAMGRAARARALAHHDLAAAGRTLDRILRDAVATRP
jgi:hypothetical protein